ncbi:MAG: glycine zipper 2TM domain-containing protein [Pseudomonadota bacterium]
MNTPSDTIKPTASANKPLWAAVGVLGIAVLAMGAALIRIQTQPVEPRLAVLATSEPAALTAASSSASSPAQTPPVALADTPVSVPNKAPAPVIHTQTAIKPVAHKSVKPAAASPAPRTASPVEHPPVQVAQPLCVNCGTVSAVTPIQRDGTGGGGGAIAGGVLGALLGNQVGGGDGKSIATVLGAVGGGFAGNAIEKKMKKETVYEVQVRMEDGSSRTFEQATPASVGAKVMVEGNTLQPAPR